MQTGQRYFTVSCVFNFIFLNIVSRETNMKGVITVLVCSFISASYSWCTGKVHVTCEHLSDIQYDGNKHWRYLTVENVHSVPNETLDDDMFENCPYIEELTIISTIKNIERFSSFRRTPRLAVLRLYNNSFEEMPSLSVLSNLVIADFQYNGIRDISGFATFTNLKSINLSHNKIVTFLRGVFDIDTLERLTLSHNEITELSEGQNFGSTLLYLNMDSNKINHIEDKVFSDLPKLEELILSNNKFTTWWIKYQLPSLKRLDLSHNSISIVEPDTFTGMPNLTTLYLDHNLIKKLPLDVFRSDPKQSLKLTALYLHNNRFEELQFMLKDPWQALREISIAENPWSCDCLNLVLTFIGEKGIELTSCDYEYFNSGDFPVCIDVNSTLNGECLPTQFPLFVYDQFFEVPRNYKCIRE